MKVTLLGQVIFRHCASCSCMALWAVVDFGVEPVEPVVPVAADEQINRRTRKLRALTAGVEVRRLTLILRYASFYALMTSMIME